MVEYVDEMKIGGKGDIYNDRNTRTKGFEPMQSQKTGPIP